MERLDKSSILSKNIVRNYHKYLGLIKMAFNISVLKLVYEKLIYYKAIQNTKNYHKSGWEQIEVYPNLLFKIRWSNSEENDLILIKPSFIEDEYPHMTIYCKDHGGEGIRVYNPHFSIRENYNDGSEELQLCDFFEIGETDGFIDVLIRLARETDYHSIIQTFLSSFYQEDSEAKASCHRAMGEAKEFENMLITGLFGSSNPNTTERKDTFKNLRGGND